MLRLRNLMAGTLFPNRQLCDNIHKLWGGPLCHNAPHTLTRLLDRNASSRFLIVTKNWTRRNRERPCDALQRVAHRANYQAPGSRFSLFALRVGALSTSDRLILFVGPVALCKEHCT
jgi:hypothetical protein